MHCRSATSSIHRIELGTISIKSILKLYQALANYFSLHSLRIDGTIHARSKASLELRNLPVRGSIGSMRKPLIPFGSLCVLLLAVLSSSCARPSTVGIREQSLFDQLSPTNLQTETAEISGAELTLHWQGRDGIRLSDFERIISADTLRERDFPGWVTQMGIGEPGLLYRSKSSDEPFVSELGTALPVTLIRRGNNLHVCDVLEDAEFEGQQLAANFTAPLAYLRKQGDLHLPVIKAMLRSGEYLDESGLFRFEPVDPNRIPVIFVHGLKSSPSIWKIMINELRRDPQIRKHYQFWSFSYPTGLPILYSAKLLRENLNAIQEKFNKEANHPTWQRMVLVGHSMGGLVSRLQVSDSGNAFWESSQIAQAGIQFEAVGDPDIRDSLVFQPLPYINRTVFMATPHGGSLVAVSKLGLIISSLIQIPSDLTNIVTDIILRDSRFDADKIDIPTSIDNLKPDSRFIRDLSTLPLNPGVTYHSIIASGGVENTLPESMNDGLVTYASASIKGAASEKIVASDHRAPNHPDAVKEVARILLEHLHADE
ncbi:MAG: hypothetical protein ACI9R3_002653 [Verrucomicrobiales bacterium]|jgi:hypothetical protein